MSPEIVPDVLNGWVVVVIDDEPDSLEVAQLVLEYYGADVKTAINGADGLVAIRQYRPRFVVCDISMPVLDGWGVIREMQRDPAIAHIPAIALTAHAMVGDRERALSAGFHNYLSKPLTPATFINDLLRLLVDIPEFKAALIPRG